MQETERQGSLDKEGPLKEEVASHSSILAWESRGQRILAGYSPWGPKSWTRLSTHTCREGWRLLTNKKATKHSSCNKMRKSKTNTCKKKLNFQQRRINIKFMYMLWRSQVKSVLINGERAALISKKKNKSILPDYIVKNWSGRVLLEWCLQYYGFPSLLMNNYSWVNRAIKYFKLRLFVEVSKII